MFITIFIESNIKGWDRYMVKCEKCGQEIAKEKQLELIKKKLGKDQLENLCANCKRIFMAEKYKDVFKDSSQ
jgi:DNA-directed RNA polymerase subunit RPC12/RpoP